MEGENIDQEILTTKRNTRRARKKGENMSIRIENEKFYILEAGNEKWIYSSEKDAIKSLRELLTENKDLNQENVSILEVDTKEEKWQIKQISWSKIAIELIRGEL